MAEQGDRSTGENRVMFDEKGDKGLKLVASLLVPWWWQEAKQEHAVRNLSAVAMFSDVLKKQKTTVGVQCK